MNHRGTETQRNGAEGRLNELSGEVIDAAFHVHTELGPGLLESIYVTCLAQELSSRGLSFVHQQEVPIVYKDVRLPSSLRLDLIVEKQLIVEIKAVEALLPIHKAQLMTYLKLSKLRLDLLINFNVPLIKNGIQRVIL